MNEDLIEYFIYGALYSGLATYDLWFTCGSDLFYTPQAVRVVNEPRRLNQPSLAVLTMLYRRLVFP